MIRNYIKIAFRNLTKNSVYSFINITGLSVGLTAFILIALWIQHELSYDRFHHKADRIYRVVENQFHANNELFPVAVTPAPLAPHLRSTFPEIENAFRLSQNWTAFEHGDKKFNERGIMADPAILDIFTFTFLQGDRRTALSQLNNLVVTEKLAKKYFGNEDPIGQTFRINNNDFVITAVIAALPENSHIRLDYIIHFEMIKKFGWSTLDQWGSNAFYSYVLLKEPSSFENVTARIRDEIKKKSNRDTKTEIYLQPLTKIHLHSKFTADIGGHGDILYIYIFSIIAAFILAIACINFMNLSTARSVKRVREVGMRKVVGAFRWQLIVQFLVESIVLSLIASMFAVIACQLFLPVFNEISGKAIELNLTSPGIWTFLFTVSLITGTVAGSYPAFFLSGFKPVTVLKGAFKTGQRAVIFRQALVVTQFSLSIILITGTILVYDQLHFIRDKKLGFEKDNVIGFWGWWFVDRYPDFKNELLSQPEVVNVTISSSDLTYVSASSTDFGWEGKDPDKDILLHQLSVDHDFIKTFNIEISEGRDFSADLASDSAAYILNEQAVREMGLEKPIGKRFGRGNIIGVVKDFHFKPIRDKIEPLILFMDRTWYARINVKLKPGNTDQAIAKVQAIYKKFSPDNPLEFTFLNADFDSQYRTEQRTGKIFNYFAFIAVFISCLGLFGLVMFTTEQRTKEIGIRKVLGASAGNLFSLISIDFIRLILISNVIAIPLAWYIMNKWLAGFAYKVDIHWTTFLIAAVSSILIAWFTMSYQSIKAALANPVDSLRSE